MPVILALRQLRTGRAPFALASGDDQHHALHAEYCFASSGLIVLRKVVSTPVSTDASIIRRIARPSRHTDRPARSPASASVFTRATLLAKVVATTMPLAPGHQRFDIGAQDTFRTPWQGD